MEIMEQLYKHVDWLFAEFQNDIFWEEWKSRFILVGHILIQISYEIVTNEQNINSISIMVPILLYIIAFVLQIIERINSDYPSLKNQYKVFLDLLLISDQVQRSTVLQMDEKQIKFLQNNEIDMKQIKDTQATVILQTHLMSVIASFYRITSFLKIFNVIHVPIQQRLIREQSGDDDQFTQINIDFLHVTGLLSIILSTIFYLQLDLKLLQQSEANKEKDLKVLKVIHDIQNPLLAIKQTFEEENQMEEVRKVVNSETDELQSIIDCLRVEMKSKDLLQIKEEDTEVQVAEFLKGIVRQHLSLAKNGANVFHLQIEEGLPHSLSLKRTIVRTLVTNIVSHSLRNMNNGIIKLKVFRPTEETENSSYKWYQLGCQPDLAQEYFVVEVMDNGPGIPAEWYSPVSGLSIQICALVCVKIDCFIRQHSVLNQSTNVRIYIPMVPISDKLTNKLFLSQEKGLVREQPTQHRCRTAIVVENNESILKFQERAFQRNDIPQVAFPNGNQALDWVKAITCRECSPVLVFTDLNMPYLDGAQLAARLKDLSIPVKIVLVSAEEYDNKEGLFDKVFMKPVQIKFLRQVYLETQNTRNLLL